MRVSFEEYESKWMELMSYPENDRNLSNNISWSYTAYFDPKYKDISVDQFILNYYDEFKIPKNGYWTKLNKAKYEKFKNWCTNNQNKSIKVDFDQQIYIQKIISKLNDDNVFVDIVNNNITAKVKQLN